MQHFVVDDPNFGLSSVVQSLLENGAESDSRNGKVIRFTSPTLIEYRNPQRRILDWVVRDANHFFHLVETMWMFAGMEEIEPLKFFNGQIAQYSDDGVILRGTAYGKRWFSHFGYDQILAVTEKLINNKHDRRAVLTMWDPVEATTKTQDYACNMQVIFTVVPRGDQDVLDMTVTNRSNDLIYGAMGSNLFHFSMLHEKIAKQTGIPIGTYYQFSTNLHIYTDNPATQKVIQAVRDKVAVPPAPEADTSLTSLSTPTLRNTVTGRLLYQNLVTWGAPNALDGDYITQVARPMMEAYRLFKMGSILPKDAVPDKATRFKMADDILSGVPSPLGKAGAEWLKRRMIK